MALGTRKAFQEAADSAARDRWLAMPYLGIDGMPKTGQAWVQRGILAATIIVPTNTGKAIEMLAHALHTGTLPPEKTVTSAKSFPAIEELAKRPAQKRHAAGTD
jgi:ABC-type sugar transport system substrate-binding protein